MSTNYMEKVKRQQSSSWVGYWPLNEESGTVVYNHVSPSGYPGDTTPEQNGTSVSLVRNSASRSFLAPDGSKCATFDGSASLINMVAALSSSAISPGTMAAWAAIPEANLSGTTMMRLWYFGVDGNNLLALEFDTVAQQMKALHVSAAGTSKTSTGKVYNDYWQKGVPLWHHYAMTYTSAGTMQFYIDGKAQTAASTLGTMAGTFATTLMCLGSDHTTISDPFTGHMAHFVWSNVAYSADEVALLADARP